jgi:hypothetical protein
VLSLFQPENNTKELHALQSLGVDVQQRSSTEVALKYVEVTLLVPFVCNLMCV